MSDVDTPRVRVGIVGIVCISLFASLFARLWYLQMIDKSEQLQQARAIHLRIEHEQGPRGRILDRNGKVLVDNRKSIVVGLDHQELRPFEKKTADRTKIFQKLAVTLTNFGFPTKVSTIETLFEDKRYGPQDLVPIATEVPEAVELYIKEHWEDFPGVVTRSESVRTYPYGTAAAHILGYVGSVTDAELPKLRAANGVPGESPGTKAGAKPYAASDEIGKTGIEKAFEPYLRGVPGDRTIQVDARGDYLRAVSEPKLSNGDDVWLSIDVDLQVLAEQRLATEMAARRAKGTDPDGKRYRAPEGAAVVIDPQTGQILAMASNPSYDPKDLVNGISTELWKDLNDKSKGQPLFNWALQGTYSPGSTFKPFVAHAALEHHLLSPTETITDTGSWRIEGCRGGGCVRHNDENSVHGTVDLARSLTISSDVFYYRLGDKFWRGRKLFGDTAIQDSAKLFGLGVPSGIDLPAESTGLVPTPEWLANVHAQHPRAFPRGTWTVGDNVNTSIGQGSVEVTPMQLANAYATLSTGGVRYVPQIALKVTHPKALAEPIEPANFDVVETIQPKVAAKVTFRDLAGFAAIYRGLQGVVQSPAGTAHSVWQANQTAFPMAGKTGTAQVSGKAATSIFAAFGPADGVSPSRYAIAVVMPEAGYGAEAAAPVAFSILGPASYGTVPVAVAAPVPKVVSDVTTTTSPTPTSTTTTTTSPRSASRGR